MKANEILIWPCAAIAVVLYAVYPDFKPLGYLLGSLTGYAILIFAGGKKE